MTKEKHENEVGFPIFPGMWNCYVDKIAQMDRHRADALYVLAILLTREISARAKIYGGEDEWFLDTLAVSRSLARVGIFI